MQTTPENSSKSVDLVLEGGGVKVIALIGAIRALEENGYTFERISGASAGSIVAALVAAGYSMSELEETFSNLDYKKFADAGPLSRLGIIGKTASLISKKGVYEGAYMRSFMYELLAKKGVRTFGDLKLAAADKSHTIHDDYKLVILAADITRGTLARLPWDYADYGLNPDDQLVADAVQASASLPFFFKPVKLKNSYLSDGGIISNFPIWVFEADRDARAEQRQTIGIKLSSRPEALGTGKNNNTRTTLSYGFSILRTVLDAQEQIHLDDPETLNRTIFVDASAVASTDFDLTKEQQLELYESGKAAAAKFINRGAQPFG